MKRGILTRTVGLAAGLGILLATVPTNATTAVGYGVGFPPALPIAWGESFSFLVAEVGTEGSRALRFSVDTYPASFPDRYEAGVTLLVKGWLGPTALYAGGGFSLEWRRIGAAWLWTPMMNVLFGTQVWIRDSLALFAEIRSAEELPLNLVFDPPQVSLGIALALGKVRPSPMPINAATAVGFGVGFPPTLPIVWNDSVSFLVAEVAADQPMSFRSTIGAYPASFPDVYVADATLLVKAWLGPAALYAGGGFSLEWRRIGAAWLWTPMMNVLFGTQVWVVDSLALFAEARSAEELPPTFAFAPQICLGVTVGLGKVRPSPMRVDLYHLWVLVGLGVLAFLIYYPRR